MRTKKSKPLLGFGTQEQKSVGASAIQRCADQLLLCRDEIRNPGDCTRSVRANTAVECHRHVVNISLRMGRCCTCETTSARAGACNGSAAGDCDRGRFRSAANRCGLTGISTDDGRKTWRQIVVGVVCAGESVCCSTGVCKGPAQLTLGCVGSRQCESIDTEPFEIEIHAVG